MIFMIVMMDLVRVSQCGGEDESENEAVMLWFW